MSEQATDREPRHPARRLKPVARILRGSGTDAERLLWSKLRAHYLDGHKFRRQHPIGRYVADFVCLDRRLVIELDGGGHAGVEQATADAERTAFLRAEGYEVLRFWNTDVLTNVDGVIAAILAALEAMPNRHPWHAGADRFSRPSGGES